MSFMREYSDKYQQLNIIPQLLVRFRLNRSKLYLHSDSSVIDPATNIFNSNKKRGCEWPIGHPDEIDFHFCNKDRFEDKPYCINHCAVAYVLPEKEESEKVEINIKI